MIAISPEMYTFVFIHFWYYRMCNIDYCKSLKYGVNII